MSNELLTKLMDPLEEITEFVFDDEFCECEREEELCTWAAKWYLDSYLTDWLDFGDKGVEDADALCDILADNNPEEVFWSRSMAYCTGVLRTLGITRIDQLMGVEADTEFGYITTKKLGYYLREHSKKILEKIREIYAARTEASFKEADEENHSTVESEQEIPEDLKKLRDPLNTESIDFFALLPTPVYGATTEVTQDDFIAWFAKNHVKKGRCTDGLSDAFQGICPWFHSSCIKLLCLIGYDGGKEDSTLGVQYVTKAALKEFYENNNSKIISKVKEIMKLWLEHGWL